MALAAALALTLDRGQASARWPAGTEPAVHQQSGSAVLDHRRIALAATAQ